MPKIGRRTYHKAIVKILEATGFNVNTLDVCELLATKDTKKIYLDVAGKNLPYFGRNGKKAFPWETHIQPDRLDKIDEEAQKHGAECWLAFCYVILDDDFKGQFKTIVKVKDRNFGTKLITTKKYRKHMRSRSPNSWKVVELPRKMVTQITYDPKDI
jgi:hypothetical protein